MKRTCRPFTSEENDKILRLYNDGKTAKEIGEAVGRTAGSIAHQVYILRKVAKGSKQVSIPHTDAPTVKLVELTPRQMIKKLYDLGYRIENNQLVCYTKNVVKIQDIIHGGE